MKLLNHSEIDFKKWDKTILNSELPLVFAQSFYLNATCPNWQALVEGDYESIMPVTEKKKLGILYLIQPPFTPQLGIYGKINEHIEQKFYAYLENKYKYISIEVNALHCFKSSKIKDKRSFVVNLNNQIEYNSNTKRNISKAIKAGLEVESVSEKNISTLSKKHLNPFLRKKLKLEKNHILIFEKLLENCKAANVIHTFVVKTSQGELSALAHFISNGKHAVYLKGTNFDRNSGSMHLLMDKAIHFFKAENISIFDFGGGQSESMAQFYSGFGANELNYKIYKVNNLPKAFKWLKK